MPCEETEKLIVSVQVLREEYDRVKVRNRKLIAQSREIATEARDRARGGCTMPPTAPSILQLPHDDR